MRHEELEPFLNKKVRVFLSVIDEIDGNKNPVRFVASVTNVSPDGITFETYKKGEKILVKPEVIDMVMELED